MATGQFMQSQSAWAVGKVAAAALIFTLGRSANARQASSVRLRDADKQYAQKSYKRALQAYTLLQTAGEIPTERRDEIAYRMVVSLGKTNQWDKMFVSGLDFVKARQHTVWEGRGLYWLGRMYLAAPHSGYRVGTTLYRGNDVPATKGDAKPMAVSLETADACNALDALEAAHVRYQEADPNNANRAIANERIQLDFDLIYALQNDPRHAAWLAKKDWLPPTDASWRVDMGQPYDLQWPQPKKIFYLYAHIEKLAAASPHPHALALFAQALWLRQYQAIMSTVAIKFEHDKPVRIPFPYQNIKPGDLLNALVTRYPADTLRDEAQYLRATWLFQEGKTNQGIAAMQLLIATRPHSKWVSDARAQLAAIRRPSVSVGVAETPRPGKPVKLAINYSNTKRIQFTAYRIDLLKLAQWQSRTRGPNEDNESQWMQMAGLKNSKKTLARTLEYLNAARSATWTVTPTVTTPLTGHSQTVTAPIREAGAYVVVAEVPGARTASLVTVSGLALVQKMDRGRTLYYAANALTGKPLAGANIVAKQWWWSSGRNKTESTLIRGVTDANGLVSIPTRYIPNQSQIRIAALAYAGKQYASTPATYINEQSSGLGAYQGYSITDRTVYRPAQMVHFRQLLMRRENASAGQIGDLKPLSGATVRVVVTDPQGNLIYKQRTQCSEWGSVSGDFALPVHAALGEYAVQATLIQGIEEKRRKGEKEKRREEEVSIDAAGNRFRVEEYKKPEFEVTVTPSAERVKLGQPTSAKIHAAYYFGGPVPGAKVTYRVYRNAYAASYRFPQPYDYLYNANQNTGSYDTSYRSGEVITQGKAQLDAKGDATVTFDTKASTTRFAEGDLSYTVEADVQDQSRRTISGTGALKATQHDVAVFLNFAHGYATQGDRVDVEVKTLNPSDQPVSVNGTVRVFRKPNDPKGKETPVTSFPLNTDAQGRAMMEWTATKAGYFRLAFETKDGDGNPVSSSVDVWVDGPELRNQRFLFQGVFLAVKNPYYAPGQMAKVLLVTPTPDCSVLLTREVEGQILDKRVVRVPGRSLELPVPLSRRDAPNVFVSAVMVRNGEMYQATQELFVPPVQQTAKVEVTADKAKYAPGETAKLNIRALDFRGKPLRAELSIAIADAALSYIQKDYAPDIRTTFYGNQRDNGSQLNGSFASYFQGVEEWTQPGTNYPLHPLPIPQGMGQIPVSDEEAAGLYGYNMLHGRGPSRRYITNGIGGGGENDYYMHDSSATTIDMGSNRPMASLRMSARYSLPGSGGGLKVMGSVSAGKADAATYMADVSTLSSTNLEVNGNYDPMKVKWRKVPPPYLFGSPQQLRVASAEVDQPTVRSNFRDLAFWTPAVVTDAQGRATVTVKWPDNLTQWRALAVGSSQTAQVGTGETRVTTKKDVLVQLESPRFLVERDIATLSAIVHNDTETDARIRVKLDLDNADVVADSDVQAVGASSGQDNAAPSAELSNSRIPTHLKLKTIESWITIPKGGQQRVDWLVRPKIEGVIHARMTAQAEREGDATETVIPVLAHGVERQTQQSGVIKAGNTLPSQVTINLPEARKAGSSQVVVTLNPSLAGVMLDALPYLADYPYGCVEQTMSRFLPAVIVARTLKDVGYNLGDLETAAKARAKALATSRTPAEQTENSPYTYPSPNPTGKPNLNTTPYAYYAAQRLNNPVFSQSELHRMVKDGLARLRDMQHKDGGWGWWKDDSSDPYMSAYVVYGLLLGQKAGYVTSEGELPRGLDYLKARFLEETDLNQMAYQARVLAFVPDMRPLMKNRVEGKLFAQREKLSAYSKALLALALDDMGKPEQARIMLRNLEDTAKIDAENGTASWDDADGQWWRWYNNKVETNATILQAFLAVSPHSSLPPMLVKWLVNNRKGSIWRDTHDTAVAVNALADWLRVTKELNADYTLTVSLGNKLARTYHVTHANALFMDNSFVVPDNLLQTGNQTLTLARQGTGTCYYTATTRTFSQEEPIPAAGNEIHISRRYFRLIPGSEEEKEKRRKGEEETNPQSSTGNPQPAIGNRQSTIGNPFLTAQYERLDDGIDVVQEEGTEQGPTYRRVELQPGEFVGSGDLLEVELGVESKNDYDYVLIEDIKPAGCEPVEVRSGEHAGQGVYSNMELRDQKVAFFISQLPQGRRVLNYRLRAETPGAFHVLPANGYAMYAPDVRAISSEGRIAIRDEETGGEPR